MDQRELLKVFGWMLLFSTLEVMHLLILGAYVPADRLAGLALLSLPTIVLSGVGAICLTMGKEIGAFAIYAAFALMGLGFMNIVYLPFAPKLVKLGLRTADVMLAINFLIVGGLAWLHWLMLRWSPSRSVAWQRGVIVALLAIAAGGHFLQRSSLTYVNGTVASLEGLGVRHELGKRLAPLASQTPIEQMGVLLPRGAQLLFSGKTSETNATTFATEHGLELMDLPRRRRR